MRRAPAILLTLVTWAASTRGLAEDRSLKLGEGSQISFLDTGVDCSTEVRAAKAKCTDSLIGYQKTRAVKCGPPELPAILDKIADRHRQSRDIQEQLTTVEQDLNNARGSTDLAVHNAHNARERLLKALVKEYKEKGDLTHLDSQQESEAAVFEDMKTKAHRAALNAEKLAETSPDMKSVKAAGDKAKAAFAKMVEQQISIGRSKYAKANGMKKEASMSGTINNLLDAAKNARQEEIKSLQRIKSITSAVSNANTNLAKNHVAIADLEMQASTAQKGVEKAKLDKDQAAARATAAKLKAQQEASKKAKAEFDAARKQEEQAKNEGLKKLLAEANKIMGSQPKPAVKQQQQQQQQQQTENGRA